MNDSNLCLENVSPTRVSDMEDKILSINSIKVDCQKEWNVKCGQRVPKKEINKSFSVDDPESPEIKIEEVDPEQREQGDNADKTGDFNITLIQIEPHIQRVMTESIPYRVTTLKETKLLPKNKSNLFLTPVKPDNLKTKLQTPEPHQIPQFFDSVPEKYQESAADTYQDEDSIIMSENGQDKQKFVVQRFSLSTRKINKQQIQEEKGSRPIDTGKLAKDKAVLPKETKLDFNIAESPQEIEEETMHRVLPRFDRGFSTRLLDQEQNAQLVKSIMTWQSEEVQYGGDGFDAKSVPFSQMFPDMYNDQQVDLLGMNEEDQFKNSIYGITPRNQSGRLYRSSFKLQATHKSSLFLEELANEDQLADQLNRLNTFMTHNSQASKVAIKEANQKYQRAYQEAADKGQLIYEEISFEQTDHSFSEYTLPDGLSILEQKVLNLKETLLKMINGSNGSKILVCQKSSISIKNMQSSSLTVRAVQFELENPKIEGDQEPTTLLEIIQEDRNEGSFLQFERTKSILFEDCAFVQDETQYIYAMDPDRYKCQTAISISNQDKDVIVEVTFRNCVFIGYHHALIIKGNNNVIINIEECMFKKQYHHSIISYDAAYLNINKTKFKKSCQINSNLSCLQINLSKRIQQSSVVDPSKVLISNCEFRKLYGIGLTVEGEQSDSQNLQVQVKECLFREVNGAAAMQFNNLRNAQVNRYAFKSNATDEEQYTKPMFKVSQCDIEKNKKNGIIINNCFGGYKLKKTKIKENKGSGIKIQNQMFQSGKQCDCTQLIGQTRLNTTYSKYEESKEQQPQIKHTQLISECLVYMNQENGVEIDNYSNGDLTIEKCEIEDNFCNGVHISASDQVEGRRSEPLTTAQSKQSVSKLIRLKKYNTKAHLTYKIQIFDSKLQSNKNTGILIEKLAQFTYLSLRDNHFAENFIGDVQLNDRMSKSKIHLHENAKGEQTNKLEPIIENFQNNMNLDEEDVDDDNDELSSNGFHVSNSRGNIEKAKKKKVQLACIGRLCTTNTSSKNYSLAKESTTISQNNASCMAAENARRKNSSMHLLLENQPKNRNANNKNGCSIF